MQPLQAGLQGADHRLAVIAGLRQTPVWAGAQGVLGGEDQVLPRGVDKLAEERLGFAELVGVGGIQEIAAGLQIAIEHPSRFCGISAMPPLRPDHAGAQDECGHP